MNKLLKIPNTLIPYEELPSTGIEYSVCRDYDHISRYKGLRQIVHNPTINDDRFIALETTNPFDSSVKVSYYVVPENEENRLDLISQKFLGSPQYSWVISYFNQIEDGFTVLAGQKLKIPKSITDLFSKGEILQSVPSMQLNLIEE